MKWVERKNRLPKSGKALDVKTDEGALYEKVHFNKNDNTFRGEFGGLIENVEKWKYRSDAKL